MKVLPLEEFEQKIGYRFKNQKLLRQALTHSSFSNEQKINSLSHYERLEFLGDAVLELVTSEYLYDADVNMDEGSLTKKRASAVCEQALAISGRQLSLSQYMLFGRGEEMTGGRERDSIIADGVEAVIGAIYLDGQMDAARAFIMGFVLNDLETKQLFYDAKSILQEIVQEEKISSLTYELIGENGPEHNKTFQSAVVLNQVEIGRGSGKTKKAAEQQAAYEALLKIKNYKQV